MIDLYFSIIYTIEIIASAFVAKRDEARDW